MIRHIRISAFMARRLLSAGCVGTPSAFADPDGKLDDETRALLDNDGVARAAHAWAVEWARAGLPVVSVPQGMTNAMLSGEHPSELSGGPWPAFAITPAHGALAARGVTGKQEPIVMVLVHATGGEVRILAMAESGLVWTSPTRRTSNLSLPLGEGDRGALARPLDEDDRRMLATLDRFVVGVCRKLSSEPHRRAIMNESTRHSPPHVVLLEPWEYPLGKQTSHLN